MGSILLVEDETIVAMENKMNLIAAGFLVVGIVPSGNEAIQKAIEAKPDLIVMDIKLKGEIDGIEAMTKIRQQSNTPVIFLTGNSDARTRERIENVANSSYLVKPVFHRILHNEINRMLAKKSA